ncbi:hypothetical protein DDJ66_23395 [Klebsiella oxytoca]|uniref:hypothetical protein n=1 Tax=Klebsiella grimontii TaxID=2058152 RepID=UPI000E356C26|nr:hypothetical protein [Klebsiella grimontii]QLO78646.1 hypothetical protein HV306_16765 [Klebsiella grimontii]RFP45628.1 hypothetical protein DDJ66_23395 [Klebsiella oxytoca]RFP46930.1 hypothetical protein DDJ34_09925 [Klebsiella oxytoca]RFP56404.1 hypothetical protein DDJ69_07730 [Klebsiella oxytoca]
MRFLIYISLLTLLSVFLFYLLNIGYYRGELYHYNLVNEGGLSSYLSSLLRFDLIVAILNLSLLILSCVFLSKNKYNNFRFRFYTLAGYFLFNFINSLVFAIKNHIRNHYDIFELNVFVVLLKEYGGVVNLVYITPLILSGAMLLLFLSFAKKRSD